MLSVTALAAKYLAKELGLQKGESVRFFVRYGGESEYCPGFRLGIAKEPMDHIGYRTEVLRFSFYVKEDDLWYLDGQDLIVSYNGWDDDLRYECRQKMRVVETYFSIA